MRIAADCRNALHRKVKRLMFESCRPQERHDKATKAAVDMQTNVILFGQFTQRDDVIHVPVGEVDCRANKLHALLSGYKSA